MAVKEKRGSARELAGLLGISERRINQLVNENVITKELEGNYILPMAIAQYYEHKYADKDDSDYWKEKAKHEAAKRKLAELELAKRKKEVHLASDVELVMTNMLTNVRSQLLGLPSKMAPLLADKSKSFIDKKLTEEITSRLTELSDYSPDLFTDDNGNEAEDD